jgi:preprotein translocase subunit Sss1
MDLQLAAGLIALCIGVIGVTGMIVKIITKKFQDLFDRDEDGYF